MNTGKMDKTPSRRRVSVHGGHSGQFCNHAEDRLEKIVQEYIRKGFTWVGITEHMPPVSDDYLFPDEIAAGLNARILWDRFGEYVTTCRQLQRKYAHQIEILVAFESETYAGSASLVKKILKTFRFDYFVGSIHHVDDMLIDFGEAEYRLAAQQLGGLEALYCRYFDLQFAMIESLKPPVVGHFDLIRIFDRNYSERIEIPEIHERICRNLAAIKAHDLILDLNVRALAKGAHEPYLAAPILAEAISMGIAVVPGDDSHGVREVGRHIDLAVDLIRKMGGSTAWRRPMMDSKGIRP
jgi:histidinol-phosphatase (PHP family)